MRCMYLFKLVFLISLDKYLYVELLDLMVEITPCMCDQSIYDEGSKHIQWEKDSLFNKWFWENRRSIYERIKVDYYLLPYTKINSRWMKDLNVKT